MNNKVKIAYVGGPDLSLRIPLIKLLYSKDYEVVAIGSSKSEGEVFEDNKIPYIYYPLRREFDIISDIQVCYHLYAIFKKQQIKLIHTFDTKPNILGRISAKLARVPIIVGTVPGLGSLFSDDEHNNAIFKMLYLGGQRIACRCSNLTIFQNQDDMRFYISKKVLGEGKGAIIKGSGVDQEIFSRERLLEENIFAVKNDLGFNSELNIVMVGRIGKYKGAFEFIQSAQILKEKYNNLQFFLIGPLDSMLGDLSEDDLKRCGSFVKYCGYRKDIPEILYCADIVVLPSFYREGVPRILLEAACMERPIITTNITGCKDVVDDGVNGFLVPPKNPDALAEAIEKLILNRGLRERMGKAGRKKIIKEFSLDVVFKETIQLYDRLIKENIIS